MISHLPIVIVGAGPVGLTAALLLIEAGHPVLVVEKNSGLARDMRAATFHPATLDLLEPLGLAEPLIAGGSIVQAWQFMVHGTKRHAVFDLELISDATRHPYALLCEQYHLTSVLLERLERSPLFDIRFNHELTAVEQEASGVLFRMDSPGGAVEWRADWLIAADGGDSSVRRLLGLPFPAGRFSKSSVTLVLDHPFHQDVEGLLGVNHSWAAERYYTLMQIRNLWRFSYGPRPGQEVADAASESAAQELLQSLFPSAEPYLLLQSNHYSQQERCMDSFRQGRVLFAGDSAHLSVPVGGMGMNSGIHDAWCLGEHLSPVLRGGDDALLERYSRRRRTIAIEEVQRLSAQMFLWLRETDDAAREAIWKGWEEVLDNPRRTREFLLETSMIRSRQREREID